MSDLARLAASIEKTDDSVLIEQIKTYVDPNLAPQNHFALASLLLGKKALEARIRRLSKFDLVDLKAGKSSAVLKSAWLADELAAFDAATSLAAELLAKPETVFAAAKPEAAEISVFDSVRCLTEICYLTERQWLRVSGRGLRAADARLLALKLKLSEQLVHDCFELLLNQQLIRADSQSWVVSQHGVAWLELDFSGRWLALARESVSRECLLDSARKLRVGDNLAAVLSDLYPLLGTEVESIANSTAALGLLAGGQVTPLLLLLMSGEQSGARLASELERLMPAAVPKIIVQSDLTVLVTGPLTADLWRSLDSIAHSTELGIASSFRMNLASVTNAMQSGWTTTAIAEFLRERSKREIPQPLHFLLRDAEQKFGELEISVEVRGCIVRSRNPILLTQIQNEPGLATLRLRQIDPLTLESPLNWREAGLGLRAAGYAALLPEAPNPAVEGMVAESSQWARELLRVIRASSGSTETTKAQLLQFALRDGIPIRVTYRGPGGVTSVAVRVLGVTSQRIRCREIGREAELTLPQSSILEIALGVD